MGSCRRGDEAHVEVSKLRHAEAALKQAHENEVFLLQKARLFDEPSGGKRPQARPRERTPPPASLLRPSATALSASPALGLEADLPQPAPTVGIDLAVPDEGPLLPRLLASFRADFAQQCGAVSGMLSRLGYVSRLPVPVSRHYFFLLFLNQIFFHR